MQMFRASFYKDLPNSEGHMFRCLQRQFDFPAENLTSALSLTEDRLNTVDIECDAVEVVPILQQPAEPSECGDTLCAIMS